MHLIRTTAVVALAVLVSVALAACGSSTDQTKTVTVVQQATPAADETSSESTTTADPIATTTDDAAEADTTERGGIRVPDVVGEDHQLAQDTMQAAGLYNLSEEDATGQGRLLLVDRNWTVVSQSPSPGSLVSEDATIVLRSKKDGE